MGDHVLVQTAVEAAKLEPHTWQAAKLRSVGDAPGGLRIVGGDLGGPWSATAAPRFRRTTLPDASIHGEKVVGYRLRLA